MFIQALKVAFNPKAIFMLPTVMVVLFTKPFVQSFITKKTFNVNFSRALTPSLISAFLTVLFFRLFLVVVSVYQSDITYVTLGLLSLHFRAVMWGINTLFEINYGGHYMPSLSFTQKLLFFSCAGIIAAVADLGLYLAYYSIAW